MRGEKAPNFPCFLFLGVSALIGAQLHEKFGYFSKAVLVFADSRIHRLRSSEIEELLPVTLIHANCSCMMLVIHKPFVHSKQHVLRTPIHAHVVSSW